MITFQVEPWSKVLPEMTELWPAHWEEIAADRDKMALDMDLARYVEMEAGGRILVLTARKAGELIGYYVWLLGTPLHHRSMLCAHTDMYWLKRDCRRGFTGVRMFRESERYLKAMGVKKLFSTTRPVLDIGRIFDRLRWEKAETVYSKFIGSE